MLFEQVISPAPLTVPSHATMLTGMIPPHHGVRNNEGFSLPDRSRTLAELLGEAGYRTGGFIGGAPLRRGSGLDQGFDEYDDDLDRRAPGDGPGLGGSERDAREVLAAAAGWLAGADPARPVFAFIHLYDPHQPYSRPLPGEETGSYDGEIAHVDDALGTFLADLRGDPRWRSAVILITADHGESLGEHGEESHAFFIYEATQRVPWILQAPGRVEPGRRAEPVGLVDVTPTLLEIAGVSPPADLDGRSVLRPGPGDRSFYMESLVPQLSFGWAELRGVRRGALKVIEAPRRELYDLSVDPGELHDLYIDDPQRAAPLLDWLQEIPAGESSSPAPDPEQVARLRSLGYLSAPPAPGRAGEERVDPKDRIEAYEQLRAAQLEAQHGDPEASLAAFALLEPTFSDSAVFYEYCGDIAVRARRLPLGIRYYRHSLLLDPSIRSARHNLATALSLQGDVEAALAEYEELLRRYPDHASGHLLAGLLYRRQGNIPKARQHLERFLALAPDHPQAARIQALLQEIPAP